MGIKLGEVESSFVKFVYVRRVFFGGAVEAYLAPAEVIG